MLDAPPPHGALSLAPDGSFVYTPTLNFNGTDTFTYHANDGLAGSTIATVTLTITPVNDAPLALADAYTATASTLLVVAAPGVLANDSDVESQPLTATLLSGPLHGSLALGADGSFTYLPNPGFTGVDQFTYQASDGQAASTPVTVTIQVQPKVALYTTYLPLALQGYVDP